MHVSYFSFCGMGIEHGAHTGALSLRLYFN
jgi:hypothetical protein